VAVMVVPYAVSIPYSKSNVVEAPLGLTRALKIAPPAELLPPTDPVAPVGAEGVAAGITVKLQCTTVS
jgi:hypothetical protein